MKVKHNQLEIKPGSPFANCKLNREQNAVVLTQIVESYNEGFVLAINNPWGTGKTTFIQMWEQHLKDNNFKTLYFNAWENDFESNPLVAIMSELKTLIGNSRSMSFESLLQKGALITQNILPTLLKALAKRYIDTELVTDTIENLTKSAVDILKDEIDEYAKKKEGLVQFRHALQQFIESHSDSKPLIFIIDELDRCRPTYAVEVLEQIKHFFNVPGIVFVLSIDKIQLGHAIRGFYGSENINSNEYLRRFIDLEYSMPAPDHALFAKYLFDYFDFKKFFNSELRSKYSELRDDGSQFLKFSTLLFSKANLTLRQQEKMFALARLALNAFSYNTYLLPSVYVLLIYLKEFHSGIYKTVQTLEVPTQDILNLLKDVFPKNLKKGDIEIFVGAEAHVALLYNNAYSEGNRSEQKLFEDMDGTDKKKLLIQSCFDGQTDTTLYFLQKRSFDYYGVTIRHLLSKVDMVDQLIV